MKQMVTTKKELAARLRTTRESAGLRQTELADGAAIQQATLSQWECGDVPESLLSFAKLALSLGTTPDELLLDTPAQSALAAARAGVNPQTLDNLLAITLLLERLDKEAVDEGPGPLPSETFRDILQGIAKQLDRRPRAKPTARPKSAPAVPESAAIPQTVEAAEDAQADLLEYLVTLPVESPVWKTVRRAAQSLRQQSALLSRLHMSTAGPDADSGESKIKLAASPSKPRRRKD